MTNAVITWASGEEFCNSSGFRSYIRSLKNIKNADFFVFTHDLPDFVRKELIERRVNIVDFPKQQMKYLLRDRHLAFTEWLNDYENHYDLFLFTDSKDVIFQRDPFQLWNNSPIMLVCEGMEHKHSLWNLNDQAQAQIDVREFKMPMQNRPVLNGGVIMGRGSCLKFHFFVIWSNTIKSIGTCTDQGVLNFLYNWLEKNLDYSYTDPRYDAFCLTGEAVKEGWIKVLYEDGLFKTQNGEVYAIVHQWDRLSQSHEIEEKYK